MIYSANIKYYDDFIMDSKEVDCFIVSETYSEAMAQMVEFYGEDFIEQISLELISPDNFIVYDGTHSFSFADTKAMIIENTVW